MVKQIQVKQWYQLMDEYVGNVKQQEKRQLVLKFRNTSLDKPLHNHVDQNEGEVPVALNDEEGDNWLEPGARSIDDDVTETELPSHSYDHLEFIDLKSPALLDFVSDTAQGLDKVTDQRSSQDSGNGQVVRKAADVDWD
ncbi:hypothetical protein FRC06_006823 [Ceratobasidium sp. 370]|nr:hypothetical protein FRC06_006823 [Ceratobasidium sp. 370]